MDTIGRFVFVCLSVCVRRVICVIYNKNLKTLFQEEFLLEKKSIGRITLFVERTYVHNNIVTYQIRSIVYHRYL